MMKHLKYLLIGLVIMFVYLMACAAALATIIHFNAGPGVVLAVALFIALWAAYEIGREIVLG